MSTQERPLLPPRSHVSGRDYLAIVRGQAREPMRPYTWDVVGLTSAEYLELVYPAAASVPPLPSMQLAAGWPTP
jgi:hypothetical protein